jgi:hypothetical protein
MLAGAIIAALIAVLTASVIRERLPRAVLWTGASILVGVWVPILLAGTFDPRGDYVGNALGLGLLAWFGSYVGFAIVGVGFLLSIWKLVGSR